MSHFPHLFQPIQIGRMTVKNRIFIPGHNTALSNKGLVSDEMIAYHEARAEAGAGLITMEVSTVHPSYMPYGRLSVVADSCIPGLQRMAQMGARHDCRVIGQLFHPGRVAGASEDGSQMVSYAPSEVPDEYYKNIPMPLSTSQIWDIIDHYGTGAARMAEGGLDGIELVSSMGYLISQFLNPRLNKRTDEFGGSAENRLRFLREIINACRECAGDDITLGIRISSDEMDGEGMSPGETMEALKAVETDGLIDFFNIIGGTTASYTGWLDIIPHMVRPSAYLAPLAEEIKAAVLLPVMIAGRINQPQDAERIIANGQADMVGIVRGHIADPEFVRKAREGRAEDIRACIGCNQACIGHRLKGFPISCIQHPETGRELGYYHKPKVGQPKRVMVVGGGPGGMKAALTAKQRGHDVTLYEKEPQLGGQALLAQLLPDRAEFGGIVTNLARELAVHEVPVRTSVKVTPEMVARENPDAIILATGALPQLPELEGSEESHVVDSWSVIRGEANVGHSVVVWDWRSDWVGLGLAQMLAQNGCRVRLAVNGFVPGERIPSMVRDYSVGELHKLGVEMVPYVRLFGIDSDNVYFHHVTSGEPVILDKVDTLVCHHPPRRCSELADALEPHTEQITMIGDCLSPRTAEEAVLEGLKVAMAL